MIYTGKVNVSGFGMIFQNLLKKVTDLTGGVIIQLKSPLMGLKLGTANLIYEDASGNLRIINPTAGKVTVLEGKTGFNLKIDGGGIIEGYSTVIYNRLATAFRTSVSVLFYNSD